MKIIKNFCVVILPIFLLLLMGCSTTMPTNHAPTINSIPVTNSFVGVLYTYDVEADDDDGDTLTYSITSGPIGMTIDSSTGVISWTPNTIGDYNVSLKVSDGESFDTQSFTITISLTEITTLSPPTGVEASDNISDKIQITWNSVIGATHYQVYRAISLVEVKTAISKWQTGTSYDDTYVFPGTTYYYWIKAATSPTGDDASDYSDYIVTVYIAPPTGVEASNNYLDKVQITWNYFYPGAYFQVYRAMFLTGSKADISKWQTGTSYEDKSATPGFTYYYWVKAALNSSGDYDSDYSDYDTGKRLGF